MKPRPGEGLSLAQRHSWRVSERDPRAGVPTASGVFSPDRLQEASSGPVRAGSLGAQGQ